jgi:transcriptional regulator with XRE-family HTH domain
MEAAAMSTSIADLLRDVMKERHINQRQLAAYLDVSPQAVSEWVKGTRVPDPPYVWKVAEMARMPIEEAMRIAGHLPPEGGAAPSTIIPPIARALAAMTEAEQLRFALKAIQLAEEFALESREKAE